MSTEKISEIVDVDKVYSQLDGLIDKLDKATESVVKLSNALKTSGVKANFATSIKEVAAAQDEQAKTTKQLTDAEKELKKIQDQIVQTQAKIVVSYSDEAQALAESRDQLAKRNRALKENVAANKTAGDSLKGLEKELRDLRNEYVNLSAAERKSARGNELLTKIVGLDKQTKTLRKSIGQSQPEVGNYGKIWGVLGGIVAKATGFIAAASGAITFARDVIASTQGTADAFEQTISGLSSGWEYFKKAIATTDFSNFIDNINAANEAGKDYAATLDDLGDRTLSFELISGETNTEIEKLITLSRDRTKSEKERSEAGLKAIKLAEEITRQELSLINDKINAELELQEVQTGGLDAQKIVKFLKEYDTAKAKSFRGTFNEYQQLEKEITTITRSLAQNSGTLREKDLNDLRAQRATAVERRDFIRSILGDQIDDYTKYEKIVDEKRQLITADLKKQFDVEQAVEIRLRKVRNMVNGLTEDGEEATKKDSEAKKIHTGILARLTEEIRVLEEAKQDVVKDDIEGIAVLTQLNAKIAENKKRIEEINQLSSINISELFKVDEEEAQTSNIDIVLADYQKQVDANNEKNAKIAEANDKFLNEEAEKIKENAEVQKKIDEDLFNKRIELAQEAVTTVLSIIGSQYDAEKNQVQDQINASEEAKDREIKAAGENADKIKVIEARRLAEKERLERKLKEIDIRKAKFERTAALINIATELAKTLATINFNASANASVAPPAGPLLAAYSYAQVPLAIASAGLQTAAILAKPIPKYEKGTDFAIGGPSIVSEKGREVGITPDKKIFFTPDKQSVMDIPRGTKIIPNDIYRMILKAQLSGVSNYDNDSLQLKKMESMFKGLQNTSNSEIAKSLRNQQQVTFNWTEQGMFKTVRNGYSWQKYVNKNIN